VAGVYLVRSAGGTVTDLDGDLWTVDSEGLVASNGQAHDAVLDAVAAGLDR
jgi:myo-inositol-1(or 4)-monophosphatase